MLGGGVDAPVLRVTTIENGNVDMDLKLFNMRDVQNFTSFLSMFEGEGVTDIRFVREEIERFMNGKRAEIKHAAIKSRRLQRSQRQPPLKTKVCPECGNLMTESILLPEESSVVLGCKHCRYSEVV